MVLRHGCGVGVGDGRGAPVGAPVRRRFHREGGDYLRGDACFGIGDEAGLVALERKHVIAARRRDRGGHPAMTLQRIGSDDGAGDIGQRDHFERGGGFRAIVGRRSDQRHAQIGAPGADHNRRGVCPACFIAAPAGHAVERDTPALAGRATERRREPSEHGGKRFRIERPRRRVKTCRGQAPHAAMTRISAG
jgi:hypothetical protein